MLTCSFFASSQLNRGKSHEDKPAKPKAPSPTPPIVPSAVPSSTNHTNKPTPSLPTNGSSNPAPKSTSPSPASSSVPSTSSSSLDPGASSRAQQPPTTPERKPLANPAHITSPAPPTVVVSTSAEDMAVDASPRKDGRIPGGGPASGTLGRLRSGSPDTIPTAGKTPRKQRSSRFHVSDRVVLERLPGFNGELSSSSFPSLPPFRFVVVGSSPLSSRRWFCLCFPSGRCGSCRSDGALHPEAAAVLGGLRFQRC